MKKLFLSFIFLIIMAFVCSCNTKVDLYADYKDVTVVYGLIDVTADTNFVKIVRAFSGSNDNPIDAGQVALIADSSNYPGKLDARIVEYRNNSETGRVIVLDTITIRDKEQGVFYAPNQKVYYTTERFNTNTSNAKYKYKLLIDKGDQTINSETGIVGGGDFRIITTSVTFRADAGDKTGKVMFKPADNAVVYEVKMAFNYKEKRPGQDTVYKQVGWSLGTRDVSELETENTAFTVNYSQGLLFRALEEAIGDDTHQVERYIGSFEIQIAAGGEELYNYIQINTPSGGFSQNIPDYTNINGGYGVFSSRINLTSVLDQRLGLSRVTRSDLVSMNWGFREM